MNRDGRKPDHCEYVVPIADAVKAGWNEPERFEWPGEVVYRFTTSTGKNVVQFLLKDKKEGCLVLKSWNELYLENVML